MRAVLLDRDTGKPIVDRDLRAQLEAREGLAHVADLLELGALRPGLRMAEVTPPLFMDVSNAYSGDELGLPHRDVVGEGICGASYAATDLAVSAGAGNTLNVAKGACWVMGDTNLDRQPNYRCFNDAAVNLGVSPDPANPRYVLVVAQVTDAGFAGATRTWALQAIHGTPAGAPVVPALPASAMPLAQVLVPAAAASSAAYTITDIRPIAGMLAGNVKVPTMLPAEFATMTATGRWLNAPSDGTEINLLVDSTNGVVWRFRYRAGSGSAFKWEFVGGPPLFSEIVTDETTASGVAADLATVGPSVTLPRAGEHLVSVGTRAYYAAGGPGPSDQFTYVKPGAATAVIFTTDRDQAASNMWKGTTRTRKMTAAAGDLFKMQYSTNGAVTAHYADRWLSIVPVRIS